MTNFHKILWQLEAPCAKPSASDPIPAIEEVGRYLEQAEARAKSVKELAKELAEDKTAPRSSQDPEHQQQQQQQQLQRQQQEQEQAPQQLQEEAASQVEVVTEEEAAAKTAAMDSSLQTFRPPPLPQQQQQQHVQTSRQQQPEVQLQQEQIQYVDNDCCQVAVTTNAPMDSATIKKTTAASRSKTDTMKSAAHQFSTLERNMAEVAEQNRRSERELQARNNATLDRRSHYGGAASCDTCDAPLTPASLAGIDHRDLEHRPLTRSVTRATVYDEPPEK